MKKVFFIFLIVILIFSGLTFSGCDKPKEIKVAACENGKIVLHEDLIWYTSLHGYIKKDFFEAVADDDYYFEKWIFLDKKMNRVFTAYDDTNFMNENFIWKGLAFGEYSKIVYIKAIFTNDETKLIDLIEPTLEVLTENESIGSFNYTTNTLPKKKVEGTKLWKYVILDDERDLYIKKVLLGVGFSGIAYNVIVLDESMLESANTYAYYDYDFRESFDNKVEYVTILIDINEN